MIKKNDLDELVVTKDMVKKNNLNELIFTEEVLMPTKEDKHEYDWEVFETLLKSRSEGYLKDIHVDGLDLSYRRLSNYNLMGFIFNNCNLTGTYFDFANMHAVVIRNSTLYGTTFFKTNLTNSVFVNCTLKDVSFMCANLCNALFEYFNYDNQEFQIENLKFAGANLVECKTNPLSTSKYEEKIREMLETSKGVCLTKKLIGWKKCFSHGVRVLVKLEIPKGAIVFSINNNKCRTNVAKVLEITSLNGKEKFNIASSTFDRLFKYRVGETVVEPNFNCQYNEECAKGIHFFKTKKEAKQYML